MWVEDPGEIETDPRLETAAGEGLRGAVATPIRNSGKLLGVAEFFGPEAEPPDRYLLRTLSIIGFQAGQIFERRQAEEEVRRLARRNELILDSAGEGIYGLDRQGGITFVNPAAARMLGWEANELIGRSINETVHHSYSGNSDYPRAEYLIHETPREGTGHQADEDFQRKDGTSFPVRYTSIPIRDGVEANGAVVTFEDITERKQTESALRESVERFRLATEAARMYAWEVDVATRKIKYSDNAAQLLGFESLPENLEGGASLFHPEDSERVVRELERTLHETGKLAIEFRIVNVANEVVWLEAYGVVVRDEKNEPVRIIGIAQDVTERKKIEEERERLRIREWVGRAATAERERISRELHDRVAHEMGIVHQSLQLYEAISPADPERAAEKIEVAKRMAKTALESTRNLSAELRRSVAEDGLEEALRDYVETVAPREVNLTFSFDGDDSPVPGHVRGQLYLILCEAIRNSVTHSHCQTMNAGVEISPANVSAFVEDDGQGFEVDGRDHEGVGLRSMRERVGLLGGELRLTSNPENGTKVGIVVPLEGEQS